MTWAEEERAVDVIYLNFSKLMLLHFNIFIENLNKCGIAD